jgi:hypothetical protein
MGSAWLSSRPLAASAGSPSVGSSFVKRAKMRTARSTVWLLAWMAFGTRVPGMWLPALLSRAYSGTFIICK